MTDHGFAADERDVHGLVFTDEVEYAIDELLAAIVTEFAQNFFAAEMGVAVGVTAGATEGAFAGDLDGKHGGLAGEDFAPRTEDFAHVDAGFGTRTVVRHTQVRCLMVTERCIFLHARYVSIIWMRTRESDDWQGGIAARKL